jgi:RHS repeat-associated protein
MLDYDSETDTDHAQFRQYSLTEGRWLGPDPYSGSYDFTSPQSLNRYTYVLNNPLSNIDPTGMYCFYGGQGDTPENDSDPTDYDFTDEPGDCGGQWIDNPSSTVTVSAGGDNGNDLNTFPTDTGVIYQFVPGAPNNGLPTPTKFKATLPGMNYCGPGGNGTPTDRVDAACAAHDRCYQRAGVSFVNNLGWPTTGAQKVAIAMCDSFLSGDLSSIMWPTSNEMGEATIVSTGFNLNSGYNLR